MIIKLHNDEPACQAQRCTDEAARTWTDCEFTPALVYIWQDWKTGQPLRLRLCGPCARSMKLTREAF